MKSNKIFRLCIINILAIMVISASLIAQKGSSKVLSRKEIEKQISIAKKEPCAEIENKLYLINDRYMFWARRGSCSDNHFGYYLIGPGLKDVSYSVETIAGVINKKPERYRTLLEGLMKNRNKPNLGLDSTYNVKLIFDGTTIKK